MAMFDDDDDEVTSEKDFIDLPIYKKGMEIYSAVDEICKLIPDDHEFLELTKNMM